MNRTQAISTGRAKTEIALVERRFEALQGAAGLTVIREDWKRVTRAMDKPRFFHLYEWYESYLNTLSDSPVYFVLARRSDYVDGSGTDVTNLYGPTEATVASSY